jgi:hypothetical protein
MAKAKQPASRQPAAGPSTADPAKTGSSKTSSSKASPPKASPPKASPPKAVPSQAVTTATPAAAPDPAPPPWPVRNAARLMYAGAVLSGLDLIVTLTTLGKSRSLLRAAQPHISPATLNADMDSLLAGSIGIWLVTIALWVVMAKTNEAGRGWARIAATFLCVASTLSFLAFVGEPTSVLSKVILIPLWLVGVGSVVLLWQPKSTAYIRAETALARDRLAGDRLARARARPS